MCTSFKLFFSVLTEIFDLEEIYNDRSRLWAFFLPEKARGVGGGGIFLINSVQCLVKKSSDPCRAPLEASVPSKCEPKHRW